MNFKKDFSMLKWLRKDSNKYQQNFSQTLEKKKCSDARSPKVTRQIDSTKSLPRPNQVLPETNEKFQTCVKNNNNRDVPIPLTADFPAGEK